MRHLAAALVLLCSTSVARAEIVTGFLEGTITSRQLPRTDPLVDGIYRFSVGETFSLSYSYDPAATRPVSGATYVTDSATFSLTTSGGYEATRTPGTRAERDSISVTDGAPDRVSFNFGEPHTPDGYIHISFTDPTGTALSSSALPTAADLARFSDVKVLYVMFGDGGFNGTAAFVTTAAVPEPSTVAMVGLMTVAGLGVAWRRRRAA